MNDEVLTLLTDRFSELEMKTPSTRSTQEAAATARHVV